MVCLLSGKSSNVFWVCLPSGIVGIRPPPPRENIVTFHCILRMRAVPSKMTIPVGCVPPRLPTVYVSVATTRCQYRPRGIPLPCDLSPGVYGVPAPSSVNRHTCENITLPQLRFDADTKCHRPIEFLNCKESLDQIVSFGQM